MESILKRDRWIVLAGAAGITILSWIYLLSPLAAHEMAPMNAPMEMAEDERGP